MKELIDANEAHFADAGGFVSPMGISYVGASKEKLGEAACCAVKRINLDNKVAKAAKRAGAGGWSAGRGRPGPAAHAQRSRGGRLGAEKEPAAGWKRVPAAPPLPGPASCQPARPRLPPQIPPCPQSHPPSPRTPLPSPPDLKEGFEVTGATFDAAAGLWTVTSASGATVKGRLLICADGATSGLATKLGYCTEAPRGVCSRAFVEGGTHNTNFDGVCFYPKWSLPGYAAIFRHPNDELNFCYYLIPCGKEGHCGDVTEGDLARLHNDALTKDPFISAALGPNPKIERMRAASLRLGSQGVARSYDDHLLIIGDAAGHIDPLTGEGIHTAMMGGKAAADTLLEMRAAGCFTAANTARYQRRWVEAFGHDFPWSTAFAALIYRYPIVMGGRAAAGGKGGRGRGAVAGACGLAGRLGRAAIGPAARVQAPPLPPPHRTPPGALAKPPRVMPAPPPSDAMASEVKRKGDAMMSKWAEVMTNMKVRPRGCPRDGRAFVSTARGPRPRPLLGPCCSSPGWFSALRLHPHDCCAFGLS